MNTKTPVVLLRKDSQGIKGTIANANHHAQKILPFIEAIQGAIPHIGFALHRAGHNVHEFHTNDGRKFTLRAFTLNGRYHGVRLALRVSRSVEIRLIDITSVTEVPQLLAVMAQLAEDQKGNDTPLLDKAA